MSIYPDDIEDDSDYGYDPETCVCCGEVADVLDDDVGPLCFACLNSGPTDEPSPEPTGEKEAPIDKADRLWQSNPTWRIE